MKHLMPISKLEPMVESLNLNLVGHRPKQFSLRSETTNMVLGIPEQPRD